VSGSVHLLVHWQRAGLDNVTTWLELLDIEEEENLFRQKQKQNVSTNKHSGGFPEGNTPIVLEHQ